jgi:inner membrane protein
VPSSFTHPVVPIAIAIAAGRGRVGWPLLAAGIAASVLPDIDFVGGWLRIPYDSDFAHRGAVHSLCFAALVGALGGLFAGRLRAAPGLACAFIFAACASHGLLDMLSHGGRGVMYFWPFSGERHFLPWQPLSSMPRSLRHDFQAHGAAVLRAEVRWVWLPCLALAFAFRIGRRT